MKQNSMYDLIGDIHGHADELEQLLNLLGYQKSRGVYAHPQRRVIFLGDFIDRGPKIRQTLEIVRPMVEEEKALAVMGNHELNALAYHTEDPAQAGEFLRRRSEKNTRQHRQTLNQLGPSELASYLQWFGTLPMWLELDGLRAVHACWDDASIRTVAAGLASQNGVTPALLRSACRSDGELFAPVEVLLKGKEAALPAGVCYFDKDGHKRTRIRTRWYLSPRGQTYRSYALQAEEIDCDLKVDESLAEAVPYAEAVSYAAAEKPVFVGHYWLSSPQPEILATNVACLDFSVAQGGLLCAYRWHGESQLSNDNFVWVTAGTSANA